MTLKEAIKEKLKTYSMDSKFLDLDDDAEAILTLTTRDSLENMKSKMSDSELRELYESDFKIISSEKELLKAKNEIGKKVYSELSKILLKNIAEYEKTHHIRHA